MKLCNGIKEIGAKLKVSARLTNDDQKILFLKLSIDLIHYEMNQTTYLNVTHKRKNRNLNKNNFLYMETAKIDNIVIKCLSPSGFIYLDKV